MSLLAVAAVLPLAVMAGVSLLALREQQADQAERIGQELVRSVANAVDGELRLQAAVLKALLRSPLLDRADFAAFAELAERIRRTRPDWAAVILSDATGATIVSTPGGPSPGDPLFPAASGSGASAAPGQEVVGDLVRHPTLGLVFPVRASWDLAERSPLALTALVRPEAIRQVLARQRLPDDWLVSVVDNDRTRVARSRSHDQHVGGRLSDTADALVGGGDAEGFGITTTLEGERVFTSYSRIETGGWTAVIGIPTSVVDAAGNRAVRFYGGGIVLSLVLGALGALWVAATITRPMHHLREAAEALGRRAPIAVPHTSIPSVRDVGVALATAAADIARGEREREELLQKERQAREQAQAADRAKDEFLAVLSHELRTPLNAVYGWARMLQGGQVRNEAMVARATDAIVRNAMGQVRLIDDLLDLSRIATGKMALDVVRVDVLPVLQAALDAVAPTAEAKGVRVEAALDENAGAVQADAGRLQQVVWNLLTNAIKFTPAGGSVRLAVERTTTALHIVISDTGEGIAPHMLPHVFDRFQQGDSSSSRRHGGLGLGLSLVKHLVELHGGTVEAQSRGEGQGATFVVTIPVASEPEPLPVVGSSAVESDAARREGLVRLDGLRVLVVDDDRDGLALAELVLRRAGADVSGCMSAAEAYAALVDRRPHVLVSDIEMPGEDGHALMRRIRQLPPDEGGATPAIALTAYGFAEDRQRALAAGFTAHASKPIEPRELTALVAEVALAGGTDVSDDPAAGR